MKSWPETALQRRELAKRVADTYVVAKNAGDRAFLDWIADRLVQVYGESPNVDYVHTLRDFAKEINSLAKDAQKWRQLQEIMTREGL